MSAGSLPAAGFVGARVLAGGGGDAVKASEKTVYNQEK